MKNFKIFLFFIVIATIFVTCTKTKLCTPEISSEDIFINNFEISKTEVLENLNKVLCEINPERESRGLKQLKISDIKNCEILKRTLYTTKTKSTKEPSMIYHINIRNPSQL